MNRQTSKIDFDRQEKILVEFRKNLSDVLKPQHNDSYLLKWLRAKYFDIEKAEQMLRLNFNTREVYQIDKFLTEYKAPEIFITYGFTNHLGFDKEGSLVRLFTLGKGDVTGFLRACSVIQIALFGAYLNECDIKALEEENKRTRRSVDNIVCILDLEGFNIQKYLHSYVIEPGLDLVNVIQELYPEIFKSIIVINAPMYFFVVFNILKAAMKKELLEKIQVYTNDHWQEHLLKCIDAEILPRALGGTSDTIVNVGRTIPPEMYTGGPSHLQETDRGVETVSIGRRSTFNLSRVIRKPGSKIILEFRSEGQSIGLSIRYKKPDSGKELSAASDDVQLSEEDIADFALFSPPSKIQSHMAVVKESYYCKNPGIYVFRFDNTYRLMWPTRILYRTTICEPQQHSR